VFDRWLLVAAERTTSTEQKANCSTGRGRSFLRTYVGSVIFFGLMGWDAPTFRLEGVVEPIPAGERKVRIVGIRIEKL
jgi:hypothetical protein